MNPNPSVWGRRLVKIPELVADPDWPLGRSATYDAVARGQIPVVVFAGTQYVVVADLLRKIHGTTTHHAAA